jgi:hypothetical protein
VLGFGANNKKIIGYATPNLPKDLSISNDVTVGVQTCTLVDQTRALCSRTSIDDEDDEADLKVDGDLGETTLRCRTSGTSAYSDTYGDHDDSRNPCSNRDVEVDGFGQGSGNSAARRRAAVVIPFSYAALREAMRE